MPPISQLHSAGSRVDVAGGVHGADEELVLAEGEVAVVRPGGAHGRKKPVLDRLVERALEASTPGRFEAKTKVAVVLSVTSPGPDDDRRVGRRADPSSGRRPASGRRCRAVSTARTRSSCAPGSRSMNSVNSPGRTRTRRRRARTRSRRPARSTEKVKCAIGFSVGVGGPESIDVSGATSTVHSCTAGAWSGMPTGRTAADLERCARRRRGRCRSPARCTARTAPRSSEHWKVAPTVVGGERERRGASSCSGRAGAAMIVVSGIVHAVAAARSSTRSSPAAPRRAGTCSSTAPRRCGRRASGP